MSKPAPAVPAAASSSAGKRKNDTAEKSSKKKNKSPSKVSNKDLAEDEPLSAPVQLANAINSVAAATVTLDVDEDMGDNSPTVIANTADSMVQLLILLVS